MQSDFVKREEDYWKEKPIQKDINNYYPKLYKRIPFQIQKPVLEIGGGSGTFLKYLKIPKATILDLAGGESLIDENYTFIKQDLTKRFRMNNSYKTIFVMELLEHIHNPLYLMSQIYNILDDEGICYIGVPYTELDTKRKAGLNSHVCRWRAHEIKDDMEKIGFSVKFLMKRRRFLNTAFWLPHCFLVLELRKRREII